MKCWTRYALPWVMAFCLFLGSLFFSLDVKAAQDDTALSFDVDAVMASIDGDFYPYNVIVSANIVGYPTKYYLLSTSAPLSYHQESSIYRYYCLSFFETFGDYIVYVCNDQTKQFTFNSKGSLDPYPESNRVVSMGVRQFFSSSYDIYKYQGSQNTGELVFQGPSPFQQAVRGQDWTAVMMEILTILPLSIVSLTFLIGLRKGLRHILTFLRRA